MGDGKWKAAASWTGATTARRSSSLTAALLASSLLIVYALVLGNLMGVVDTHASTSTGGHHVTTVVLGGEKSKVAGKKEGKGKGKGNGKRKEPRTTAARIASEGRRGKRAEDTIRPPPPTAMAGRSSSTRPHEGMASSIAKRWNLTAPEAVSLLERQFDRVDDYSPERDFVHFHHLYKSGGTSISNLMDETLGPRDGGGILPGSYESGNFDHDEALADINRRIASGTRREDLPYAASYAHTGLRPVHGPHRTRTGIFLLDQLPHRRLRVITMLRDVVDFRASNHAMIMCGLNYEVMRWNKQREERGLPRVCSPRDGLNISEMVDNKIRDLMERCRAEKVLLAKGERPEKKLFPQQRKQCADEESGIDTLAHCRSADHLLASPQYDKHYRSMYKALMGRFHREQEFTNSTAYKGMGYGFERAEESRGYSIEKVEEYTLQDLGGLDTTISAAANLPEPDFVWFGITERMKESTALFYFQFRVAPLPRTPDKRVQECRPNSWWTIENREVVKEREPADYAVWRAANAIMDVRMEKMKMEIRSLLRAGETRESLYYVDWDQLEEMGVEL